MKIIDMTCPKCGASLKPDLAKGNAVCEYCGHHILIEQEDTIEEIRVKAQSRAYGYYKAKLEAKAGKKEKYRGPKIGAIVIGVIVLIAIGSAAIQELAKPKINPFDYIEVSFQGKDGEGKLVMDARGSAEDIDVNRIEFDISKENDLLQGETISIHAASQDYRLAEKTRVYTVDGLDEYLKDLENVPEEVLDIIHRKAESSLDLNLESSKNVGAFIDMKPVKLFLTTDGKQTNELYDVFEVRFMTQAGEKTYYVMACFDSVVVRAGEQVSIDMSGGTYKGQLIQVEDWLCIMGYDSLEEIRADILTSQDTYMELKELDL